MSRSARTLIPFALALLLSGVAPAGIAYADDGDWECGMMHTQLRSRIASQGYSNVKLNVPSGGYVQANGDKGGVSYLLAVNACNGQILGRQQRGAT